MTYKPLWETARDFIEGSRSVKNPIHRKHYLPMPDGMSESEYNAYVERAEFSPFATRTWEGVLGLMFSKEIQKTIPEKFNQYLDNVDGKGNDLYKFIKDVTSDCAITGWGGCLIDAPNGEDMSLLQAEREGVLPYLTYYRAEKIINVQTKIIGRKEVVTKIVIKESEEVPTTDPYVTETKDRYKVLEIETDEKSGHIGKYKLSVLDESYRLISENYPKMFGEEINFIPFFFMCNTEPTIPMFMPVIDVNKAWYHKSADYENGLHWTGCPTPICIGYTPETMMNEEGQEVPKYDLKLGGSKVVFFPQGVNDVRYLEFNGAGLSQLSKGMQEDEERMAILGARIISAERKGVESAETARIHRASENSVIATFANEVSKVFNNILYWYLSWSIGYPIEEEIKIQINTDYDTSTMSPQELTTLVSAWQSGAIDKTILFKNMQKGELIDNSDTFEDMQERIAIEKEQNFQNDLELQKSLQGNIKE